MSKSASRRPPSSAQALIEHALLGAVALAFVAMLSFPAARGTSETLGWMPLWLTALPLSAWAVARTLRRRAALAQARRPLARVHRLAGARPRTETKVAAAPELRRAA